MKNIPVRSITAAAAKNIAESFKIRTVTEILGGKNMFQDYHRHDFYFILFLKKGSGNHEIDFVKHRVADHSVFFMRPGQVHRLELKSTSSGYLMEFGHEFFHLTGKSGIFRRGGSSNFCRLEVDGAIKLENILASMHGEVVSQKENFQDVIKASLTIFFIELARLRQGKETANNSGDQYMHERLQDFLELLEKDIRIHKKVSHYADKLNLSRFQLNSITKTLMGKTAAELIDTQILLEAKRYLLATSGQVNQIAYDLGYEDVSYFIRFFKKHTGFTPEAFRQNL